MQSPVGDTIWFSMHERQMEEFKLEQDLHFMFEHSLHNKKTNNKNFKLYFLLAHLISNV